MLTAFDHIFLVLFGIAWPTAGYVAYRRLLKRIAAGHPVDRAALYRSTVTGHWSLFVIGGFLWFASGRDLAMLGLHAELGTGFFAGLLGSVGLIGFMFWQLRSIEKADLSAIAKYAEQMGDLSPLLPHDNRELLRFYGVSVTAGIVEELLWRAYLMWYLQIYFSLPVAALISGVGFGLAHAYQGPQHVLRIALVGAALAGLYILSGSIWLPIAVHAVGDMLQGRIAYDITRRNPQPAAVSS